jgi:hypothetical protein
MNKTIKVVLSIGLAGLGVFVWTHFAAAGKPVQPVVTFIAGDVIAAPQSLGGKFTATIDFAKHLDYPVGDGSAPDWRELLTFLGARNPITYDSLQVSPVDTHEDDVGKPMPARLDFRVTINGIRYIVTMNAFLSPELTEITPTLKTYHWHEGRFAIMRANKLALECGRNGGGSSVDFSMTQ